jgi:hypothetical protein
MMRSTILLLLALTVSAFGQAFPGTAAYQAAFLKPAAAGGGGSPEWHYSIDPSGALSVTAASSSVPIGSKVVPSASGTASKLRVWVTNYVSTVNCKIALYNSSLGLLKDGGTVSITGDGWHEVNIASQAVSSSTTYYVFFHAEVSDQWEWSWLSGGASNTEYNSALSYVSFPTNPFTSEGSLARTYPVAIYVTP